jgi:hypothetical protein
MKKLFLFSAAFILLPFAAQAQDEIRRETDNSPNRATDILRLTYGAPANVNRDRLFTPIFPLKSVHRSTLRTRGPVIGSVWNEIQLTGPASKSNK